MRSAFNPNDSNQPNASITVYPPTIAPAMLHLPTPIIDQDSTRDKPSTGSLAIIGPSQEQIAKADSEEGMESQDIETIRAIGKHIQAELTHLKTIWSLLPPCEQCGVSGLITVDCNTCKSKTVNQKACFSCHSTGWVDNRQSGSVSQIGRQNHDILPSNKHSQTPKVRATSKRERQECLLCGSTPLERDIFRCAECAARTYKPCMRERCVRGAYWKTVEDWVSLAGEDVLREKMR
jgi:hypothetical protein